jgi:glycosyltransferase involved in cell wall biosynthesis
MTPARPALVVLSSLFPSSDQPLAGIFVRERMFRVARALPLTVVSPQPWFPGQSLLRRWRPGYRPDRARFETQSGIEVHRPRFFAFPGVLRRFDGFFMALAVYATMRRLKRAGRADILDAHFAYPDGYAATRIGRWLGLPVTITLRGTEPRHAADPALRPRLAAAVRDAARVFSVSASLREVALELGTATERTKIIGNGVDLKHFTSRPRAEARAALGLPADARVLVTVGGLVERKGFHRVIDCLPALLPRFPGLHYLVVGGPSPEGDWTERLHAQVDALDLRERVHFLGPMKPQDLAGPLSAADVFVLATSNEGWANVFLEAMACGLPVVTTRVGGNAEVVCRDALGMLVAFGDQAALTEAIAETLSHPWDSAAIRTYAEENQWDRRVETLVEEFRAVAGVTESTCESRLAEHAS